MGFFERLNRAPMWAKFVGIGVIGLIFGPIALLAIKGLLGLVVAITVAAFGIFFFPVMMEGMRIGQTKALKGLWASNPIETLQNQYTDKVHKLDQAREALQTFIGKVNGFRSRLTNYKQQFPKNIEKHKLYQDQYEKFFSLQQLKERKFQEAMGAVARFGETVKEAEAEWEMAKAAQDVNLASDFNNDPMELLKARTALTAVQDAMNTSLAELDVALLEEPRFDNDDNVIDIMPTLKLPEAVKVSNK